MTPTAEAFHRVVATATATPTAIAAAIQFGDAKSSRSPRTTRFIAIDAYPDDRARGSIEGLL